MKIQGQGCGEVKVQGHNMGPTTYLLTSFSFHVNQPSQSWDTAISKYDFENLRLRSLFKATWWFQHPIDSHPFRSLSMDTLIFEIQLFQNLTLKIQGQDHGKVEALGHKVGPTIFWPTHPFNYMSIGPPIPEIRLFKKLTLKIQGQGHSSRSHRPTSNQLTSLPFHVNQPSHSWYMVISKFDLENPKVKVMHEVKVQGHLVGPTFHRLTSFSFHANLPSTPRYVYLKILPWKSKIKVTLWAQHPLDSHPFCSTSISPHMKTAKKKKSAKTYIL